MSFEWAFPGNDNNDYINTLEIQDFWMDSMFINDIIFIWNNLNSMESIDFVSSIATIYQPNWLLLTRLS